MLRAIRQRPWSGVQPFFLSCHREGHKQWLFGGRHKKIIFKKTKECDRHIGAFLWNWNTSRKCSPPSFFLASFSSPFISSIVIFLLPSILAFSTIIWRVTHHSTIHKCEVLAGQRSAAGCITLSLHLNSPLWAAQRSFLFCVWAKTKCSTSQALQEKATGIKKGHASLEPHMHNVTTEAEDIWWTNRVRNGQWWSPFRHLWRDFLFSFYKDIPSFPINHATHTKIQLFPSFLTQWFLDTILFISMFSSLHRNNSVVLLLYVLIACRPW